MPERTSSPKTERPDVYETVTARIVAELREGAAPWVRPWSAGDPFPRNGLTGRRYQGNNIILLWLAATFNGYRSAEWFTYLQAQQAGGQVRKGEKGTHILKAGKALAKGEQPDGEEAPREENQERRVRSFVRTYVVFNRDQIDGLPEAPKAPELSEAERIERVEAFLAETGADVAEHDSRAAYWPERDVITMPPFGAFKSAAHFYSVRFHEQTHWTGARSRLNRLPETIRKGSPEYAQEELVAELGAAFLCAHFGIDGDLRHPGYLAHYIAHLEDDKAAFFRAATAARQAVAYLFELTGYTPPQGAEEADEEDEAGELAHAA